MPAIAPTGNPMAISTKVTQVCWSKSPDWKPVTSDEKMRLGLLIRKGSTHLPEAISQRRKNPPMIANRAPMTPTPRLDSTEPEASGGAPTDVAGRGRSWSAFSAIAVSSSALRGLARGERYSTSDYRLRQNLLGDEFQKYCAVAPSEL